MSGWRRIRCCRLWPRTYDFPCLPITNCWLLIRHSGERCNDHPADLRWQGDPHCWSIALPAWVNLWLRRVWRGSIRWGKISHPRSTLLLACVTDCTVLVCSSRFLITAKRKKLFSNFSMGKQLFRDLFSTAYNPRKVEKIFIPKNNGEWSNGGKNLNIWTISYNVTFDLTL